MMKARITHADGAVWIGAVTGPKLLFTTGEKRRNNPAATVQKDMILDSNLQLWL